MSAWQALDAELALWRSASRRATFWCRDDDAFRDSPPLLRLLEIAERTALPVALATIPAALERSLVGAVAGSQFAIVVQHGYAHRNHAPPEERKMELGLHRDAEQTIADSLAAPMFCAALSVSASPPCSSRLGTALPRRSSPGCPRSGPRPVDVRCAQSRARRAGTRAMQCARRSHRLATRSRLHRHRQGDRAHGGAPAARREAGVDAQEPTGILAHHLAFDVPAWPFLDELLARTRAHGAATWVACARDPRRGGRRHLRPISMKRT